VGITKVAPRGQHDAAAGDEVYGAKSPRAGVERVAADVGREQAPREAAEAELVIRGGGGGSGADVDVGAGGGRRRWVGVRLAAAAAAGGGSDPWGWGMGMGSEGRLLGLVASDYIGWFGSVGEYELLSCAI
jgi:hypothetical protein